ncbi:MAG: acyl-CoA reductase [Bacteroidota bacterium]
MVNLINKINAFAKLGEILRNPDSEKFRSFRAEISRLRELVVNSKNLNPWFTPDNVQFAINSIGQSLRSVKLEKWIDPYNRKKLESNVTKNIGVVMAGNVPGVGFHDYISVLMAGHRLQAKLSSDDNQLMPLVNRILEKIEPSFLGQAVFTDGKLENFDAIIATGSNNTARYFEYYFGSKPNIIRKNRNGVAVLTGRESDEELVMLGTDIFRYFGLGCRNVSKLYLPDNYRLDRFFENLQDYNEVINHHKYANNYDYNKSIYLVNKIPHLDNGFLLLKEDPAISSPVAVLHYEHYHSIEAVNKILGHEQDQIQCIVSTEKKVKQALDPGTAQKPELWHYADGIDTMEFLLSLK